MSLKQRLCLAPLPALVLGAFLVSSPKPAQATIVTATLCIGPEYPCLPADTLDTGFRANGVNVLGPNQWAALPFTFADAQASFTGNIFVADAGGTYIYSWGTGTATMGPTPFNLYLDVAITQNYVTAPGVWAFAELNDGSCNAAAGAAGSTSTVLGLVNGAAMAPLTGFCPGPYQVGSGPYLANIGLVTNLTSAAQFVFGPSAGIQTITLPWGNDLPFDQVDFDFNSINNGFITPSNIPQGFTDAAPEPASFSLIGGGLLLAGMCLRRRKK